MADRHGNVTSLEVSVSRTPRALSRPRMVYRNVNYPRVLHTFADSVQHFSKSQVRTPYQFSQETLTFASTFSSRFLAQTPTSRGK
eukprot:9297581-Ditylum_brightwellii.AAC.1